MEKSTDGRWGTGKRTKQSTKKDGAEHKKGRRRKPRIVKDGAEKVGAEHRREGWSRGT